MLELLPRFQMQKGVELHSLLEGRYQVCSFFCSSVVELEQVQVGLGRQLAYWRGPTLGSTPLSDKILTTTSQRGEPWTTLLGEGRFGIASRPFG